MSVNVDDGDAVMRKLRVDVATMEKDAVRTFLTAYRFPPTVHPGTIRALPAGAAGAELQKTISRQRTSVVGRCLRLNKATLTPRMDRNAVAGI